MTNKSKTRKKGRNLTPLLIFLAILVVLALIITLIFCLPLQSLGMSDKVVFNGKTVADLKLERASISKLLPLVKSLFRDNSNLADNAPTVSDFTATDVKFAASSANQLGHIQYSSLIYKNATFDDDKPIAFSDRQLAAMLQKAVEQAPDDVMISTSADVLEFLGSRALKDILNCLETFDVTVEHVKLASKGNSPSFELLASLDVSQYVEDKQAPLFGTLQSRVYVTLTYALDVSVTGKLQLSGGALSVNGKNTQTSQMVLDALLIAMNDGGDPQTSQTFIDGIAAFTQVVFEHVGAIGSGVFSKGTSGVNFDKPAVTFVPHTGLFDF